MVDFVLIASQNGNVLQGFQNTNKVATYKIGEPISKLHYLYPHYVMATSTKKPLLYIWNISQDSSVAKYVLPAICTSITSTPCGQYIAAACDNNMKLWHLPTGQLVNTVSSHYQKISCLTTSPDGRLLISGGNDNLVNVWEVSKIIANQGPTYTFTDHSMPLTDLHCGFGGFKSRLFTAALDNTCNIYEMSTGSLMLTVEFPAPLSHILVNSTESFMLGVSVSTDVYKVSLVDKLGTGDISQTMSTFIKCEEKITSCSLTDRDESVLVGTDAGSVYKYDTESGQILPHNVCKNQQNVIGILNICLQSYKRNNKPQLFPYTKPLQRSNVGLSNECSILLNSKTDISVVSDKDFLLLVKECVKEDTADNTAQLQARVNELSSVSEDLVKFVTENLLNT